MSGLIIAATGSGCGKTTITLGILRALRKQGISVRSAKSGPDYIDPRFHEAASGKTCVNLDAWAMPADRIRTLAEGDTPLIIEGAMGLFDGAPPRGKGATADLARILGLPVVLVLDVSSQSQSAAAVMSGFANFDPRVHVAGVILNKLGSPRHERMIRDALAPLNIPVLGAIYRTAQLKTPSRHLGLVQAAEHPDLENFLDTAAALVQASVDLDAVIALAQTSQPPQTNPVKLPPPTQRIAVASDRAFAFAYPHLLSAWSAAGAQISFFSPLDDQAPAENDLVILPGGYPELHAGRLAAAETFKSALRNSPRVYGECGGYMTMGDGLTDAQGTRHEMLGLLRLETSFATRKLNLGYRSLTPLGGPWSSPVNAHEFHYATTISASGDALFQATDAAGEIVPAMGLINGPHSGSFAHVIDISLEPRS
jgi:cobyrinic acid a,c-diamide synthase